MYQGFKTRQEFEGIPQMRVQSWAHLPTKQISAAVNQYCESVGGTPVPDAEAVTFYALNQMVAVLRTKFTKNEVLSPLALNVYDHYQKVVALQSERLMNYLFMICTRESRHCLNKSVWWPMAKNKKYEHMASFFCSLPGGSSQAAMAFRTKMVGCSAGDYTTVMTDYFNTAKWSGGYGGKKWGNVADCLRAFIVGETSAEMMVDTGYTLAHNGGPIFNKGMLYAMYTGNLIRILDVQRAGMMVEAINPNGTPDTVIQGALGNQLFVQNSALLNLAKAMVETYPSDFGTAVDWEKVKALGAMGNYEEVKKKVAVKAKAPEPIIFQGKKVEVTGVYNTGLGSFPIFKRAVA